MAAVATTAIESSGLIPAAALMALRNLELRARAVVEGDWSGRHRSPAQGFSVEFTEYRQYAPGDDLRFLDWRALARSDRYYLKKFEDETNVRCHFVVDQSRSMNFGSGAYSKSGYAATLAATLAYFLHRQGDAVGLLTFDERVREYMPARHRVDHLRRLMQALEAPAGGAATDLFAPLERLAQLLKKRGLVVFLSDFLAPLDNFEARAGALTAAGHELAVIQVLDPAEKNLSFSQATLFRDSENDREIFVDPAAIRSEYIARLGEHNAAIQASCQNLGASYRLVLTDQPLELELTDFVRQRNRRSLRRAKTPAGS